MVKHLSTLMAMTSLTKNEKLTLYGLVRYPTLTDRELSEKIGLNQSTINKIKNRLKKADIYFTIRVPFLQHLGAELFAVIYGSFPSVTLTDSTLDAFDNTEVRFEEAFYAAGETNQGFGFAIARNYTDMKKDLILLEKICREMKFGRGAIHSVLFSAQLANIYRFFDYAPLLRQSFGLKIDEERQDMLSTIATDIKEIGLNSIEKKGYHGLIKYPEATDKGLAEKIKVTRHAVTKMRRNFEAEGLLKTINIPNLQKLGFEVLAFGHIKFRPDISFIDIKKHPDTRRYENNIIFAMMEEFETIFLGVFENFSECKRAVSQITEASKTREYFSEDPNIMMFSIPDLKIWRNHSYEAIVRKILGMEDVSIDGSRFK